MLVPPPALKGSKLSVYSAFIFICPTKKPCSIRWRSRVLQLIILQQYRRAIAIPLPAREDRITGPPLPCSKLVHPLPPSTTCLPSLGVIRTERTNYLRRIPRLEAVRGCCWTVFAKEESSAISAARRQKVPSPLDALSLSLSLSLIYSLRREAERPSQQVKSKESAHKSHTFWYLGRADEFHWG